MNAKRQHILWLSCMLIMMLAIVSLVALFITNTPNKVYRVSYTPTVSESTYVAYDDSQATNGYVNIYVPASSHIQQFYNGEYYYTYVTKDIPRMYTLPLTCGDGMYSFKVLDSDGNELQTYDLDVQLSNEFLPFLASTSVVNFYDDVQLYHIAGSLAYNNRDVEAYVNVIIKYVYDNIKYDESYAHEDIMLSIDNILFLRRGVCLDKAILACALLRVQGIPTKLVFGSMNDEYHAWCEVYIDGQWCLADPTMNRLGAYDNTYKPRQFF